MSGYTGGTGYIPIGSGGNPFDILVGTPFTPINAPVEAGQTLQIALEELQGQINEVEATTPANYAEVAINGVDGTNLNLTINGALTALGSANGIINLFPNYGNTPYSMPTMSLNNKKITSVDACSVSSEINFCNIQADVGTLPVASGDLFSISNCLIAGTVANPVPVVINNIIGVVATFNDVQFVSSYPNAGISITAGATIGTSHYYFNNCTGTIALNGSPNNFIYIYFNNCNMTINNNAPQGAAFWIQDNNSELTINSNSGHWNCFNTTFGINSTISGGIHDVFSAINCNSTSIVTFGDGNPFTTSGLVNVLLYNCQMNHNANSYNANTIIVGSNNTVVNLQSSVTPTYNLLMSQCQITANCNTVDMVINLPPLNTPSTFIHLLPYLIFQFNKQDASTRTLTIVAPSGDYIQYGAQQVNSITLNTPQSFNLGITSPNNTTSAWIAI